MTESEWLEITKVVRGNWNKFCVERQQFDTFYDALKEFDVRYVREAADRIIKEFGYFPLVATFVIGIEKAQKDERYGAEQAEKAKQDQETKSRPIGDGARRWIRFSRWLLETGTKCPVDMDDRLAARAKFEKDHPNWQPRRRRSVKRGGMSRIGGSLENLFEKEEL